MSPPAIAIPSAVSVDGLTFLSVRATCLANRSVGQGDRAGSAPRRRAPRFGWLRKCCFHRRVITTETAIVEQVAVNPGAVIAPGFGDLAEGMVRPSNIC
jgi:hypothetical protein